MIRIDKKVNKVIVIIKLFLRLKILLITLLTTINISIITIVFINF